MKKSAILILFLAFLVSCGPSINLTYQNQVNNYFSMKSGKNYSGTAKFTSIMPFKVGQWVITSTVYDNKKSIAKTSIVGEENGAWIIENYSLNEYEESIGQFCIKGLEKVSKTGNLDDIELVWIKMLKDGKVESVDGVALNLMKGFFKKSLTNLAVNITTMNNAGTVTVPAGTFSNVMMAKAVTSVFGMTYNSESYYHSDVPINGMVKSILDETKGVTELVDFGLTGAKASF